MIPGASTHTAPSQDEQVMNRPTERFSSRVENYLRYRPGYPQQVIATLCTECGLTEESVIADIGSGTGILTEMFLRQGNQVYAVEPNREMRTAGEQLLNHYAGFDSINGAAEMTTLAAHSVDFITAGQAFHWFDRARTKIEFSRILKSGGWVVLLWNERLVSVTPFLQAYEDWLMTYATDYDKVDHRQIDDQTLTDFFGTAKYQSRTFPNQQDFDFAGLRGRALSSSYVPEAAHPHFAPMMDKLQRIFLAHAENGQVSFAYETRMYYGPL